MKRDGDKSIVRSRPKTDFWRKTFYGYITDNPHFFYLRASGDFTFQARVAGLVARGPQKGSIETSCSVDGQNFTTVRQGYFVPEPKVQVGIMCAAPEGPGFEATFSDLKLELG